MVTKVGSDTSNSSSPNDIYGMMIVVVDATDAHVKGQQYRKDRDQAPHASDLVVSTVGFVSTII